MSEQTPVGADELRSGAGNDAGRDAADARGNGRPAAVPSGADAGTGTDPEAFPGVDEVAGAEAAGRARGLVREAVRRPLAARWAVYADEVNRLVDATYRVVERTGTFDPTVREILRESGLSNQAFYRHFRSKDELLVALLDDGRRRMGHYLERRIAAAPDVPGKIRAWVEGVLVQAADPAIAARTRPFLAHQDRLAELFPAEHRSSGEALMAPLEEVLRAAYADLPESDSDGVPRDVSADALTLSRLTLACVSDHLRSRTAPSREETDHLVRFVCKGLGITAP
ncbi:TetR/AcrR family transcriptional regulator [Yinghuangia sp. YIM S10712]|uniref:TetR/AcrR family transcriptional regulator n=1 Tax=Yinghuangia sp. YIM S10712 TaxID=3436930 RepID=UPI003F52A1EE